MKQPVEELLDLVYRYYPRGVRDSDPRYESTEEYRRLVEARRRAGTDEEPWRALLRRLEVRFPACQVQNQSFHLLTGGLDACYSAWLWLRLPTPGAQQKSHRLGFLVSFLASYYVVYSSRFVQADRSNQRNASDTRQEICFELTPDEQSYAGVIVKEIEATFLGYDALPAEVGSTIVPDVVAGNQAMGTVTLFHCLFTDNW